MPVFYLITNISKLLIYFIFIYKKTKSMSELLL